MIWTASTKYVFDENSTAAEAGGWYSSLSLEHPVLRGLRDRPAPPDLQAEMTDHFSGGKILEPYQSLLLEARELLHMRQQRDLSITVAGTAFEAFLQNHLIKACRSLGIATLPPGGDKHFEEAIERGNIRSVLIEQYMGQIFPGSSPLKDEPEHTLWVADAYEPRNAIIHRGKRGSSEPEAIQAIKAVERLIECVEDKFPV